MIQFLIEPNVPVARKTTYGGSKYAKKNAARGYVNVHRCQENITVQNSKKNRLAALDMWYVHRCQENIT